MTGSFRVAFAGMGATVQDGGRHGYLRFGVTPAGPMDWVAFRTANLALGNAADAAALEIGIGGLELICETSPVAAAFAGGAFLWRRNGTGLPVAALLLLEPGEMLSARPAAFGAFTYLAVAGGFAVPLVMGSRATHLRSAMGGIEGRCLRAGDMLPVASQAPAAAGFEAEIGVPWLARDSCPFRVVLGPQDDYFSPEALRIFFSSSFTLTPAADRMAYRLAGPEIAHARGHDIISDGVALGAVQVAGDRQPLVLMADRQPTGGYPKLGHLARADIGRLAQLRPGETCRFQAVSVAQARAALLGLEDEVAGAAGHLRPLRRALSCANLLEVNLIDGVCDPLGGEGMEGNS